MEMEVMSKFETVKFTRIIFFSVEEKINYFYYRSYRFILF